MTDERTPEQREADEQLLEAITRVVNLKERDPDDVEQGDVIVTDFVVAAHGTSMVLMEEGRSQYAYITKDSGQGHLSSPAHVIQGLLLRAQAWFDD